jgi:hypothetical protein
VTPIKDHHHPTTKTLCFKCNDRKPPISGDDSTAHFTQHSPDGLHAQNCAVAEYDPNACSAVIARSVLVEDPNRELHLWCVWGCGSSITEQAISSINIFVQKREKKFMMRPLKALALRLPQIAYSVKVDPTLSVIHWWNSFTQKQQMHMFEWTALCRARDTTKLIESMSSLSLPATPVVQHDPYSKQNNSFRDSLLLKNMATQDDVTDVPCRFTLHDQHTSASPTCARSLSFGNDCSYSSITLVKAVNKFKKTVVTSPVAMPVAAATAQLLPPSSSSLSSVQSEMLSNPDTHKFFSSVDYSSTCPHEYINELQLLVNNQNCNSDISSLTVAAKPFIIQHHVMEDCCHSFSFNQPTNTTSTIPTTVTTALPSSPVTDTPKCGAKTTTMQGETSGGTSSPSPYTTTTRTSTATTPNNKAVRFALPRDKSESPSRVRMLCAELKGQATEIKTLHRKYAAKCEEYDQLSRRHAVAMEVNTRLDRENIWHKQKLDKVTSERDALLLRLLHQHPNICDIGEPHATRTKSM